MNARPPVVPAPPAERAAEIFRQAFHQSPAVQCVIRIADDRLIEVNDTFLAKLGYTREQVIGRCPRDLDLWVDRAALEFMRAELEARGSLRDIEMLLRGSDGAVFTLLMSTDRVTIGGEAYFVSAGVDLTGRKEAEARLHASEARRRESEAQFSTAFRSSPAIMTIATLPDGRFVEVNAAFTHTFGFPRAEAIGRNTLELNLWASAERRAEFFARLAAERTLHNVEAQLRHRNGTLVTTLISAEVIEISGTPHLLTFGLDITQRKQAELELQNALAKERELSQLKTDFVSLVSHEFRTPLEVIMSSADNLERYHERLAPEKRAQLLRTINKSVRRMADMMEEVLLLGRMESNRVAFHPADFDLAAFCRRVRDEMEAATGNRCPLALETKRLPPLARGDEAVLRHILTNLVANAVKYSPAGAPVRIEVARAQADAVFRIVDRGCGIPRADQPRLFQAFHRAANVRHIPGTGLGLVIVQRCVALHGGRIAVESAEGEGTTFTVRLPLFPAPPAKAAKRTHS